MLCCVVPPAGVRVVEDPHGDKGSANIKLFPAVCRWHASQRQVRVADGCLPLPQQSHHCSHLPFPPGAPLWLRVSQPKCFAWKHTQFLLLSFRENVLVLQLQAFRQSSRPPPGARSYQLPAFAFFWVSTYRSARDRLCLRLHCIGLPGSATIGFIRRSCPPLYLSLLILSGSMQTV